MTADRTIDLALPNALPLADVLPQVMRYADPGAGADAPVSWTLARMGGSSMSLAQTLAEAGVQDGDVLQLRPEDEDVRPAMVEDVRDAVEDSVDAAGGVWTTRTTRSFAVTSGSVLLLVVALISWWGDRVGNSDLGDLASPASAVVAVAVLLFGAWWSDRFARDLDAQVATAAAMGWAALLGADVADSAGLDGAAAIGVAGLASAIVAGLARALTPAVTGHVAFAVSVAAAGLVELVTDAIGLDADHVRRVLPVLALLASGVVPRVSLSVGGLASADYRVRHVGRLDLTALRARYRASNAILVGGMVGICAVVAWACVGLFADGGPWDRTLAAALAVALVLRSRMFSRTQHMLAPRIVGGALLAFGGWRLAVDEPSYLPWVVTALALVVALGMGLGSMQMSDISRARVKRLLNTVEFLVVVVVLVLLAGALGIYHDLGGLFR